MQGSAEPHSRCVPRLCTGSNGGTRIHPPELSYSRIVHYPLRADPIICVSSHVVHPIGRRTPARDRKGLREFFGFATRLMRGTTLEPQEIANRIAGVYP